MKLTKSALLEIIAEEPASEANDGEEGGEQEDEKELKTDVQKLLKYLKQYLPAIDNAVEYNQLLKIILRHPVKVGKG